MNLLFLASWLLNSSSVFALLFFRASVIKIFDLLWFALN